jgi:AcrR family transcriptional regulator
MATREPGTSFIRQTPVDYRTLFSATAVVAAPEAVVGIKDRQDRDRRAVREAILDAARQLFLTEGYRHVSIRKIAERIEYSPAAIYSYFPSKDDIFFALAEEGFRRLDTHVRAVAERGDPLDDVRACWWAYYRFSREQREFFELMFVDRAVPQITEQWTGLAFVHQMLEHVSSRIQRCIDAGVFPAHTSADVVMHVLWAALTGPAVIGGGCRLAPGEDPDALARDVLEVTLAGVRAGVATTFVPCHPPAPLSSVEAEGEPSAGVRRHDA